MKKILIALVLAVVMSGNGFSKTGHDHGQSITFCYNEHLFSTMSETDEYFLSVDSRGSARNITTYYLKNYKNLSSITLKEGKVVDLDNDGKCEVMGYEDFVNYDWDIPSGFGQVLKLYEISQGKFMDVLNINNSSWSEKIQALYNKETEKLLNIIDEEKYYSLQKEGAKWRGLAKPLWASILAMNPNDFGVKLFSKYYNETFLRQDLIDLETKLFEQGYWSEEFYKTHPLLNLEITAK